MHALAAVTVLLLAKFSNSSTISDNKLTISTDFFLQSLSLYKSQHDIVDIFVPLNDLNFDKNIQIETLRNANVYIFFIEADVTDNSTDYKGLYVMKNKAVTKLLDNGRDFAASSADGTEVFLAATDGIYVFNPEENNAEKYGTISDNFIGIAVYNETGSILALSEDRVLYNITDAGTNKEVITDVKDAVQIVLDYESNLFFMDNKKDVYVKTVDGEVNKIDGIPSNLTYGKLIRPATVLRKGGVSFIADKKVYEVIQNGTSEFADIFLEARPTAVDIGVLYLQYYAYEKQIYHFNLVEDTKLQLQELQAFFDGFNDSDMNAKSRKLFHNTPKIKHIFLLSNH